VECYAILLLIRRREKRVMRNSKGWQPFIASFFQVVSFFEDASVKRDKDRSPQDF